MSVALRVASRLGLFSRTFLLLTVLMTASLAAWLQAFRSMEVEPRAQQASQPAGGRRLGDDWPPFGPGASGTSVIAGANMPSCLRRQLGEPRPKQ